MSSWKINTSNKGKFEEFKRLFAKHGCALSATHMDLKEIDAEPLIVVAHKASQVEENVLIEDTSLDVEGADVGVNVRWLLDHLSAYVDRKVTWTVLLAYRKQDIIYIIEGKVNGTIVSPKGEGGFGFDPVFLPEGSTRTLAEDKPDEVNARAFAVDALLSNEISHTLPAIYDWNGPWQRH